MEPKSPDSPDRPGRPERRPRASRHQPANLKILYEDRDIVVVDKAPGLLTIGTDRERERTAYAELTDYVRKGNFKSRERVFIVHRLDRETSGLLVFARTEEAKRALQEAWDDVCKTYLALVDGIPSPEEGVLESLLEEVSVFHVRSTRDPARGRLATTRYRVLKVVGERALVEVDLLTGRKHQIRVHLSEAGWPVLGDDKYCDRDRAEAARKARLPRPARLALHAWRLEFPHPHTGETMRFEAPPPGWFWKVSPPTKR